MTEKDTKDNKPFPGYNIPGMSEKSPDCGNVRSIIACSKGGTAHFKRVLRYNCNSLDCPECYIDLTAHDARKIRDRFELVRVELRKAGLDPGHPFHVFLSPPPSMRHLPIDKLRPIALKYAQDIGIIGGCIVAHPYRGSPQVITAFREGRLDLEYSPHFHIIGFLPTGRPTEKSNDFHSRTGWIYGNKGNKNRKGAPRNIYHTAHYELGHASREPWHKHQLYSWFGVLHSSKIKTVVEIMRETGTCPVCHADLDRLDDHGELQGPYVRRVEVRRHSLRPGTLSWLQTRHPRIVELFHPVCLDLVELCGLDT